MKDEGRLHSAPATTSYHLSSLTVARRDDVNSSARAGDLTPAPATRGIAEAA